VDDLITSSTSATIKTALEYGDLSMRPALSESEVDRVKHILTQASNDPILNFWIDQIDYCLGYQLGLMDPESQADYRTQQVILSNQLAVLFNEIGQDPNPQRDQELIEQARRSVQTLFN
jgi:hypothetical protein